MTELADLQKQLYGDLGELGGQFNAIAQSFADEVNVGLEKLKGQTNNFPFPKTIHDPCWGSIELNAWELIFIDTSLYQRLRGIKQLGMAYLVYPGAMHDRLGHSLGVTEASDRMITALHRNAINRSKYGKNRDESIKMPRETDRFHIRLAAVLHDIGHGPVSHAAEPLIGARYKDQFVLACKHLRAYFAGVEKISEGEIITSLLLLSPTFNKVFSDLPNIIGERFSWPLQQMIVARILGSTSYIDCSYLSSIISGTIDADKLDYMKRDSYFSGLPTGLDVDRLINKLEVVILNESNIRELDKNIWDEVEKSKNRKVYKYGISPSGLTAYEQMVVSRAMLYDRIYYHHKVRSAESMFRLLVRTYESEKGEQLTILDYLDLISDDSFIKSLSHRLNSTEDTITSNLAYRLNSRLLYKRAFALAERFFAGFDDLDKVDARNTRSAVWNDFLSIIDTEAKIIDLKNSIVSLANQIREITIGVDAPKIEMHHVIIDAPLLGKTRASGTILVRTEGGGVTKTNMYFDPEKWSAAFRSQKHTILIISNENFLKEVSLASAIVLFEAIGIINNESAYHYCKNDYLFKTEWKPMLNKLHENKVISSETMTAISNESITLCHLRKDSITLPEGWIGLDHKIFDRITADFKTALPSGIVSGFRDNIERVISAFCILINSFEKFGVFKNNQALDEEREFQPRVLEFLQANGIDAIAGAEIGGGETDIIAFNEVLIENKVERKEVQDVDGLTPDAPWQARRYSSGMNRRVFFTCIAYKFNSEVDLLPQTERIQIKAIPFSKMSIAIIEVRIPFGYGNPSSAKRPKVI